MKILRGKLKIASRVGDSKGVYSALGKATGTKGRAVDLRNAEVWRKSESSLKVLWELMRVMWVRMSEESEDDQMPDDWIDATLVCLYKGKGSRLDPKMYRGISLISSMEKIFTMVILNRIRSCVDRVIKQQQGGFRPNKSTRDVGVWFCGQTWRESGGQRRLHRGLH